jgi:NTE family protein
MHAAFAVGVLKAILENVNNEAESGFRVTGLSGTSAGALCALMTWYGLAPKKGVSGSGTSTEAIKTLEHFWQDFVARTGAETLQDFLASIRMPRATTRSPPACRVLACASNILI